MVKTVKDGEEFRCEMERRYRMYGCGNLDQPAFLEVMYCHEDGTPYNAREKRIFCEMEKLALGLSDTSYLRCMPVEKVEILHMHCADSMCRKEDREGAHFARIVKLYFPREDLPFIRKMVKPIVEGKKIRIPDGAGGCGPAWGGTACAYPGGCD